MKRRTRNTPTLQTLLSRELAARGWSSEDLSEASQGFFSSLAVEEILNGGGLSTGAAEALTEITGYSGWSSLEVKKHRKAR